MRRSALMAFVLLVLVPCLRANVPTLQVPEAKLRALISEREIRVTVSVQNPGVRAIAGVVSLELIDPAGAVQASREQKAEFAAETTAPVIIKLDRPVAKLAAGQVDPIFWYRLRYRVGANGKPAAEGIVALGAIAADVFALRSVHPEKAIPGRVYQVRVNTANPVTRAPVAGVQIIGTLEFGDDEKQTITVVGRTNSKGDAALRFRLPKDAGSEDAEFTIEGIKSGLTRQVDFSVELVHPTTIIASTDKSLYQPGQALHVRALVLGPDRHALANQQVNFKLEGPEDTLVFRGAGKTNRFGIANIDWQLPDNLRLGNYWIQADTGAGPYSAPGSANVRVSRYDLPNFSVTAKPDRAYYLPAQNAEVDISADYLFGKPVAKGAVRVIHESSREWNYKEQKWEIEEEEQYTGQLDGAGHCKLHLDLSAAQDDFREQTGRFRDLNYAAYVTDASTGRTEQRRFQLRLSHEPIHVYVVGERTVNDVADFYVSTFYADGAAASCRVQISEVPNPDKHDDGAGEQVLRTVSTNRYGVAKVSALSLRNPDQASHELRLTARDASGAIGKGSESLWSPDRLWHVTTDKALYKAGEELTVFVRGPSEMKDAVLDVVQNGASIASQHVRLRQGNGWTVFPYQSRFQGELNLLAYTLQSDEGRWYGSLHRVLYPHNTELQVSLRPAQQSYRPGEEASASVRVQTPAGSAQESALGVVVLDKAVEERARTDQEFGARGYVGFWDWGRWYAGESFGGFSRADLDRIDMSQPVPDGLDLVAQVILDSGGGWWWNYSSPEFSGYDYENETAQRFRQDITRELQPVSEALKEKDAPGWEFPTDLQSLKALVAKSAVDSAALKDPWGTPFEFRFDVRYRNRVIEAISAGPDKRFDTSDDFTGGTYKWEYFSRLGTLINQSVTAAHERAGGFVRDMATLRAEVLLQGVDLSAARDPWGKPYRFEFAVNEARLQINVSSAGPPGHRPAYEISVWTTSTEYFREARNKIDAALAAQYRATGIFPRNDADLETALKPAGISVAELRDPWGNPFYVTYARTWGYGDTVVVQYAGNKQYQNATPATRQTDWVSIRSAGPDGKRGTADDFAVADFSQVVATQSAKDAKPQHVTSEPLAGGTGAIRGVVTDQSGAVITGAKITAKCEGDTEGAEPLTAIADSAGAFVIRGIRPTTCVLAVFARGFRTTTVTEVPVTAASVTVVNVTLLIGSSAQTVEVTAGAPEVETSSASVAISRPALPGMEPPKPVFTPRLRQFFPETLYWEPSLITDRAGKARLQFKLADNITTWKLAVVASSESGEVGMAETEIGAFQPFFAEHEPPRVLTVGDEIALPVIIRNYLEHSQQVDVQLHPADWFTLAGADKQVVNVAASDFARVEFPFRARTAVHEAGQRVTAANRTIGDAVEKPVTVHPDGQESTSAISRLVGTNSVLDLELPADMIPGSQRTELKFYADPLAHVVESIEGGLHRPYGCGEQTISSTYPSVLVLKYYKEHGGSDAAIARRATKYLHDGYERLLTYRDPSGGFTYWGRGEPDVALTAYAVRFLGDVAGFREVDGTIIADALQWLMKQQNEDGSWGNPKSNREAITGYISRILARAANQDPAVKQSVQRALAWLEPLVEAKDDPYPLATFALAAWYIGDRERAGKAVVRLRKMAHHESEAAYWTLETNTPFYSWGRAGRVETTALALQALATVNSDADAPLLDAGLLFILHNKDRYGVWYSGQTTVNVLDALLLLMPGAPSGGSAEILVNGKPAGTLAIGAEARLSGPLTADLTRFVSPGANRIEIRRSSRARATAQVVATYYLPWRMSSEVREETRADNSRALRLGVRFDKVDAHVGDEVRCAVSAERIGHRGYGMMVAEIGIPPGAEVDRASLQRATEQGVERYDILPDRIIVYLWPQAGGVNFDFTFRLRMAMKARTAPSSLFDYYNPDAQLVVPPADFKVSGAAPAVADSAKH